MEDKITCALDIARELGASDVLIAQYARHFHADCEDLVSVGVDMYGREQQLERRTASQWQAMVAQAAKDGVTLSMISAYRSFDYQRQIIQRKLAAGQTIDQILRVSALPGYSEHHTGRAIDIGTPGSPPLTEAFEQTPAFAWLTQHAAGFGFTLSYPRNNTTGIIYEPWHWLWNEVGIATV